MDDFYGNGYGLCIFVLESRKIPINLCHIISYLLTLLARAVLRNIGPRSFLYGPRARFVRS